MYASMARRSASARPSDGSDFITSKAAVVRRIAALLPTTQCETRSARAPAWKNACAWKRVSEPTAGGPRIEALLKRYHPINDCWQWTGCNWATNPQASTPLRTCTRDSARKTDVASFHGKHYVAERDGDDLHVYSLHDEHGYPAQVTDRRRMTQADLNRYFDKKYGRA